MAGKLEIQWSPVPNKFITWGSEICLYEVEQLKDNTPLCKSLFVYKNNINYEQNQILCDE